MLELSDDSRQQDDDSRQPTWDDLPDTRIVEITPDYDGPTLPPSMEQNIINDILNGTLDISKLPATKKERPDKRVN